MCDITFAIKFAFHIASWCGDQMTRDAALTLLYPDGAICSTHLQPLMPCVVTGSNCTTPPPLTVPLHPPPHNHVLI